MRRNRTTYRGRFFDYYIEERAQYPYDRWTWVYGTIIMRSRGRQEFAPMGESDSRPDPKEVFTNLLTK